MWLKTMSDVKWIKITTDIFDDEKILLIESLPEADSIIVIWFKLLCLAGKQNNSGVFMMGDKLAYTDKMLATIFRRKEATVQMALQTFEQFGMVEIIDGVITIPNWGKHQNLEQLEARKEYQKEYHREYRKRQKEIADGTERKPLRKHLRNDDVNSLEGDIEEDIERDKEEDKNTTQRKSRVDYQRILDLYHEICISFPKVRTLSDSRKRSIKARLEKYSLDEIKEAFTLCEASDFLKGKNDRGWKADFDWIMNDTNIGKILDGKYSNRSGRSSAAKNYDDVEEGYL